MKPLNPRLDSRTTALRPFVNAGVLDATAVHVASVIARATGGLEFPVLLGAALAVRAPQYGHTCIDLDTVASSVIVDEPLAVGLQDLPWPNPRDWAKQIARSAAVRDLTSAFQDETRPLVWDGTRLYLERYWRHETNVAKDLLARAESTTGFISDLPTLDALLGKYFTDDGQRAAARIALSRRLAVICGGPGTGKTTTMAQLVVAVLQFGESIGRPIELALAAPTGKAARRMTEAVQEAVHKAGGEHAKKLTATTLHKLLGSRPRFKNSRDQAFQLPHDIVIIDETSMIALPMFANLLDAVRPDATVVLIGDPNQLQSIEAGAVLAEIIGTQKNRSSGAALAANIAVLDKSRRAKEDSKILDLAAAIRNNDADLAIDALRAGPVSENEGIEWINADDERGVADLRQQMITKSIAIVTGAEAIRFDSHNRESALDAELGLASHTKILCATRYGPLGTYAWTDLIEASLPQHKTDPWYVGRPVIVTVNDPITDLVNGDVGVVLAAQDRRVVAFRDGKVVREVSIAKLTNIDTWWAMTIHKSQGSEFEHVVVTLPADPSPSLTRELFYTAVTRAKTKVTVVATEESIRVAIARPATRASGLGGLLWD